MFLSLLRNVKLYSIFPTYDRLSSEFLVSEKITVLNSKPNLTLNTSIILPKSLGWNDLGLGSELGWVEEVQGWSLSWGGLCCFGVRAGIRFEESWG